jgi:hypothetical protein
MVLFPNQFTKQYSADQKMTLVSLTSFNYQILVNKNCSMGLSIYLDNEVILILGAMYVIFSSEIVRMIPSDPEDTKLMPTEI